MDFLGDTTHHDYKAMSPAWPDVIHEDAAHLQSMISNEAFAIELEQDQLRSLFPQYSKLKWNGATSDETSDKEAELKGMPSKLKNSVAKFEAYLAEWNKRVVEEKGEKRKRSPSEETNGKEGIPPGFGNGSRLPPATKAKTSTTNTASDPLRFEEPPSTIPRPIVQNRYKNVRDIDPNTINVGDIGWAPLPRMSLSNSTKGNIPSEYGDVCIKVYPFIIVKELDDCMLGLVISTAGGQGLKYKDVSIRQGSTYVTGANFKGFAQPRYGWTLSHQGLNLEVAGTGYDPAAGAFVDMLDTHKIYYNSRFEKQACLRPQSRANLGRMRFSALLWQVTEA